MPLAKQDKQPGWNKKKFGIVERWSGSEFSGRSACAIETFVPVWYRNEVKSRVFARLGTWRDFYNRLQAPKFKILKIKTVFLRFLNKLSQNQIFRKKLKRKCKLQRRFFSTMQIVRKIVSHVRNSKGWENECAQKICALGIRRATVWRNVRMWDRQPLVPSRFYNIMYGVSVGAIYYLEPRGCCGCWRAHI